MTVEQAFLVLGIENNKILTEADLKRIFREVARMTHPDSNPDNANAMHKFEMIHEAYRLLEKYVNSGEQARDFQKAQEKKRAEEMRRQAEAVKAAQAKKQAEAFKASQAKQQANTAKGETNTKSFGTSTERARRDARRKYASHGASASDWERYEEADRKFAYERRRQAEEKAQEEIRRRRAWQKAEEAAKAKARQFEKEEQKREEAKRAWEESIKREQMRREEEQARKAAYQRAEEEQRVRMEQFRSQLKKGNDIIKTMRPWATELILFLLFALVSLYELGSLPFVGRGRVEQYASNAAYAAIWILMLNFIYQGSKLLRRRIDNWITTALYVLVALEVALGIHKVIVGGLESSFRLLFSFLLLLLLVFYESRNFPRLRADLSRGFSEDNYASFLVLGEYVLVIGVGFVFVTMSMFI